MINLPIFSCFYANIIEGRALRMNAPETDCSAAYVFSLAANFCGAFSGTNCSPSLGEYSRLYSGRSSSEASGLQAVYACV